MAKILHNPTTDATIDTVVEGVNYVIEPGQTKDNIPDSHALNLVTRYEFLEVVEDGGSYGDEDEIGSGDLEPGSADNAPAAGRAADTVTATKKTAARKTAARKTAAKKVATRKTAAKSK